MLFNKSNTSLRASHNERVYAFDGILPQRVFIHLATVIIIKGIDVHKVKSKYDMYMLDVITNK